MSASISLLRSRRKVVGNYDDDSGDDSDCSIKDVKKKESIEQGARAIAAINMLTVSMVNQLLEQQGLDPFGKSLASPSVEDDQSWSTPMRNSSRPSITRSIKENTLVKKSRKSVRFTPDCNKTEVTPERSCDSDRMELTHTRSASLSALKMEPKFTPIRRSKVLKAGMLRSLENEQDIGSAVDSFVCSNDSFESPLPIKNLVISPEPTDDPPQAFLKEVVPVSETPSVASEEIPAVTPVCEDETTVKESTSSACVSSEKTVCEGDAESTSTANPDESIKESSSDKGELNCETPARLKWCHHFDPTSPEHMSPFLKTLLEERAERSQGKEISKSFSMLESSDDQPNLSVLKGVVAFVEVRRADEDRSAGFRWKLKQLGAQVEENFTKKVTHVVFQEGLLSTYRKAKDSNIHLVSAFWVMACDESTSRVPEDKYPIDEEEKYSMLAPLKKYIKRPKLMSPDLGDGMDEKRLARRLQAIKRRSMKIEGTLNVGKAADTSSGSHSSKTSPDAKTPQTTKRNSAGKKSLEGPSGSSSNLMTAWLTGKKKPETDKETTKAESVDSPRKRTAAAKPTSSSVQPKVNPKFEFPTPKLPVHSPRKRAAATESTSPPVQPKANLKSDLFTAQLPANSPRKRVAATKSTSSSVQPKVNHKFEFPTSKLPANSPRKRVAATESISLPVQPKATLKSDLFTAQLPVNSPRKRAAATESISSPVRRKANLKSDLFTAQLPVNSPRKRAAATESTSSPVRRKANLKSDLSTPKLHVNSPRKSTAPVKYVDYLELNKPKNDSTHRKTSPKSRGTPRDVECRTPVKKSFNLPSSPPVSDKGGRTLRSTPKKDLILDASSRMHCDTGNKTPSKQTPPKTKVNKSLGKGSLSNWLSAKEPSPAKRSLTGAFKSAASSATKSTKRSRTTCGDIPSSAKIPGDTGTPRKKPRIDATPTKKAQVKPKEEKLSNVPREVKSSPKKSSGSSKASALGGSSRSKDSGSKKKKSSPAGNSSKRNKVNDKCQTVLTSHFRPLVVRSNPESKEVTNDGELFFRKDSEDIVQSIRTTHTHFPDNSDERQTVMPMQCRPLVDNPCETDVDKETLSSCEVDKEALASCEDPESPSGVPPLCPQTNPSEEPGASLNSVEESSTPVEILEERNTTEELEEQRSTENNLRNLESSSEMLKKTRTQVDAVDERRTSVDVMEESKNFSNASEELQMSEGILEKPGSPVVISEKDNIEELRATTDAPNESRTIVDVQDLQRSTADVSEEPRMTATFSDELKASANVPDEPQIVADVPEEPQMVAVVPEDHQMASDVPEEPQMAVDVPEERQMAADVPEEPQMAVNVPDDHQMAADVPEVPEMAVDVPEEHQIVADVPEEPEMAVDVPEERQMAVNVPDDHQMGADIPEVPEMAVDVPEEPQTAVDVPEEPQTAVDVPEEPQMAVDVSGEPQMAADFPEKSRDATDVSEEPREATDVPEKPREDTNVPEEPREPKDVPEEPRETMDVPEEPRTTTEAPEEPLTAAGVSKEPQITADVPAESLTSADVPNEPRTIENIVSEPPSTADVLPNESTDSAPRTDQEGSCDSFSSSLGLTSSESSFESCRKKGRKSVKSVNKPSHYCTRRSMRFVASEVTD